MLFGNEERVLKKMEGPKEAPSTEEWNAFL